MTCNGASQKKDKFKLKREKNKDIKNYTRNNSEMKKNIQ